MKKIDKILQYLDNHGISVAEFERTTNMGNGYLSKVRGRNTDLSDKVLDKIKEKRPQDYQAMFDEGKEENYLSRRLALKNQNIDITIPFYDVEAIGGTEYGADMQAITRPSSTINIGDLLRDSRAALRVYGNSMIPGYPPGCVIGLVEKSDKFIHPGHVYVIETGNNRYVKRLYYNEDQSRYVCASDNTQVYEQGPMKGRYFYPLFEIPINSVSRIFDVTGVVKRNSNTIIINE